MSSRIFEGGSLIVTLYCGPAIPGAERRRLQIDQCGVDGSYATIDVPLSEGMDMAREILKAGA
jgi:hypothetical protein